MSKEMDSVVYGEAPDGTVIGSAKLPTVDATRALVTQTSFITPQGRTPSEQQLGK